MQKRQLHSELSFTRKRQALAYQHRSHCSIAHELSIWGIASVAARMDRDRHLLGSDKNAALGFVSPAIRLYGSNPIFDIAVESGENRRLTGAKRLSAILQ
jgi:hypothetical protein